MTLCGVAKIELTDIHTGKKEVIVHKNLVTKAVNEVFGYNPEGTLFCINGTQGENFNTHFLPLCPNTIGGILLFQDPLTEDENKIYAPSVNVCVGCSSNDVNGTTSIIRGSLNQTESQKIDNGYRFVFDFTTSQGNGTISAVALTHKYGGVAYYGDIVNASSRFQFLKTLETDDGDAGTYAASYIDAVELDFESNTLVSITKQDSNLLITKMKKCFHDIGLNASLRENGYEVRETHTITPSTFQTVFSYSYGSYTMFDFFDGKDGYWYGFSNIENATGNATVYWIKINKTDYTFTEGVWTLSDVQLYHIGYRNNNGKCHNRSNYGTMRNGYLYIMNYAGTGMYKINANNVADIKLVSFGFTSLKSANNIFQVGDWILGQDFVIRSDDTVIQTINYKEIVSDTPLFECGPYLLNFHYYVDNWGGHRIQKVLRLNAPYLATINNLSVSVVKTADKTMKITYTLTETA